MISSEDVHGLIKLLTNDRIEQASKESRIGILDLRKGSQTEKENGRFESALCIKEGVQGLKERFSWLPPRTKKQSTYHIKGKALIVLCDTDEEEEVKVALKGWDVISFITEIDTLFWEEVRTNGLVRTDAEKVSVPHILFEPSELAKIIVKKFDKTEERNNADPITLLDLGCGAGRDIAWIARNAPPTWLLTGIDNLYSIINRARLLVKDMSLHNQSATNQKHIPPQKSAIESIVWAQVNTDGSMQALKHEIEGSKANHGIAIPSVLKEGQRNNSVSEHLSAFAKDHLPHSTFDILFLVRFFPLALLQHLPALSHIESWIAISQFTTITDADEKVIDRIANLDHIDRHYSGPPIGKRFELEQVRNLLDVWQENLKTQWTVIHHSITPCEDGRPLRNVIFSRTK